MKSYLTKYFKGDPIIWAVIVGLAIFSMLAVYSSTGTLAYKYQHGNTFYYLIKHSSFLLIGLIIIFIIHNIHYKYYSRLSQLFLYLSIPLLALTLIIGTSSHSSPRWLTLPVLGFTFQTSDFAKLALIMFIARLLSLKQDNAHNFKTVFKTFIIPVIIVCMLILPADFSTASLLFITSLVLMFIGRMKIKHILSFIVTICILISIIIIIAPIFPPLQLRVQTIKSRTVCFFNPDSKGCEDSANNFQPNLAKMAIVNGGIIGKGPGNSIQRNFLPNPYSDFIYAIIIEEYGIIGAIVVMLLYLFLLYRAGVIIRKSSRTFPAFLTIGLIFSLVFQAMINMAVSVNLFPVTGQTLPFISMGGTSILFTSFALGIILSVSRYTHPSTEPLENAETQAKADYNNQNVL